MDYNLDYQKTLQKYKQDKLLRCSKSEHLLQYNYSEYANNEGIWDEITTHNRGNIYEKSTGRLIAKCFSKFKNWEELSEAEQIELFSKPIQELRIIEKKDGCLGIIYNYQDKLQANSRGAFNSFVTDKIKELLPKYNLKTINSITKACNLIVEVISPQTKIICDYGDEQALYLLGGYYAESTKELPQNVLNDLSKVTGLPLPKDYSTQFKTWEDLFKWQETSTAAEEGFVVSWWDNSCEEYNRVKVKGKDYLRIAAIRRNFSKHNLWTRMRDDLDMSLRRQKQDDTLEFEEYKSKVEALFESDLPDELYKLARKYEKELKDHQTQILLEAQKQLKTLTHIKTRDLMSYFNKEDSNFTPDMIALIFNLRNGKSCDRILIKAIEPSQAEELNECN